MRAVISVSMGSRGEMYMIRAGQEVVNMDVTDWKYSSGSHGMGIWILYMGRVLDSVHTFGTCIGRGAKTGEGPTDTEDWIDDGLQLQYHRLLI